MTNEKIEELKKELAQRCLKEGKTPYKYEHIRHIMDSFEEGRDVVSQHDIHQGDSLTFGATMKSMLCPVSTDVSYLNFYSLNVKEVVRDYTNNIFAIITPDSIVTNLDFSDEMREVVAEAMINRRYGDLAKMTDHHEKLKMSDAKQWVNQYKDYLGLSDSQLRKIEWNPRTLYQMAIALTVELQCSGVNNGIDDVRCLTEQDIQNQISVVQNVLSGVRGLDYKIEQSEKSDIHVAQDKETNQHDFHEDNEMER